MLTWVKLDFKRNQKKKILRKAVMKNFKCSVWIQPLIKQTWSEYQWTGGRCEKMF